MYTLFAKLVEGFNDMLALLFEAVKWAAIVLGALLLWHIVWLDLFGTTFTFLFPHLPPNLLTTQFAED